MQFPQSTSTGHYSSRLTLKTQTCPLDPGRAHERLVEVGLHAQPSLDFRVEDGVGGVEVNDADLSERRDGTSNEQQQVRWDVRGAERVERCAASRLDSSRYLEPRGHRTG